MSHSNVREEKNCLNCGHLVEERFCSHCGQENVKIEDSAFHLVVHYFQDLIHYDGKLWHTIKNLFRKPGQVQVEYMDGKRKSHLEPIRFYVFASTVFFLFVFFNIGEAKLKDNTLPKYNVPKRLFYLNQEKAFAGQSNDTAYVNSLIQSLQVLEDSLDALDNDTLRPSGTIDIFGSGSDSIRTDEGWFMKLMRERASERTKELNQTQDGDQYQGMSNFWNEFSHRIPQLFFVSLPFLAFFLKLLYFNSRRKKYVDHFIFSIYQYSYVFLLLTFWMAFQWVVDLTKNTTILTIYSIVQTGLVLYLFIYLFLSMKRFYNDRYRYLAIRYFLLMIAMFLTLLFLLVIFFFITFLF